MSQSKGQEGETPGQTSSPTQASTTPDAAPTHRGTGSFLLAACCFVATANSATIGYDSSMMVPDIVPSRSSSTPY